MLERHGLVAVPVDLDLETLQPQADGLEAASELVAVCRP